MHHKKGRTKQMEAPLVSNFLIIKARTPAPLFNGIVQNLNGSSPLEEKEKESGLSIPPDPM